MPADNYSETPPPEKIRTVSLRLTESEFRLVNKRAASDQRSKSSYIRWLIMQDLDAHEADLLEDDDDPELSSGSGAILVREESSAR